VQILVATEGCGAIEAGGVDPVTFAKGDAVVVPAGVKISAYGRNGRWNF
jgi:uncharacterized protein YjlB